MAPGDTLQPQAPRVASPTLLVRGGDTKHTVPRSAHNLRSSATFQDTIAIAVLPKQSTLGDV